ncbi:DUF3169 family protein [Mesobacillus maritimus]|uniref:DUF3169 family protein n=1 Tax=Mesobacillus maritimus TaxID=1643336 RepID=UPI00203DF7AB|nr:DUF3169 family protein [Mesobacillus maritimus]MCM3587833.1 DUF3169 family protein [Mesobacillus maritimus]
MKILMIYLIFFVYGLYKLFFGSEQLLLQANLLMISNLVVIICLMFARFNVHKAEKSSVIKVDIKVEDTHQVSLERMAYTALTSIQVALSLSFTASLVGFLLLRDTQPDIVLWSLILLVVSFLSLFPSEKMIRITNPNFNFPNPQSKNYEQEFFNQFDDGEKYVMLKGLYKLYSLVTWGLVLLAFILMFYSAFTGDSQLVSIIGIGVLLLLIQVSYTISLKPSN